VFQRHPTLQFVIAEAGSAWVPDTLKELDRFYNRMKNEVDSPEYIFGGATVASLDLKPSEYFARNCHIAASFLRPNEAPMRHEIGIDKLMWGSDYPHRESSYPYTREHLRLTFEGIPPEEVEQIVTLNAAKLYGFDLELLAPIAAVHGPAVAEVAMPISLDDIPHDALMCPAFAAENQRVGAA
jgi:predicted TIM-barrel fold metal-dependent hydrolase